MHFSLFPVVLLPLALGSAPTGIGTWPMTTIGLNTESARFAGTVRGRITDQSSGQPVPGAQVIVAGTRLGAAADNNGRYVITQVPAGAQTLTVRLLGYAPKTATVTVTDNGEVTVDFTIEKSASQLSEVVVTATGDQRKVEIGNAVATLRADSLMMSAPITSVGDMLQGRVAGLLTFANAGVTGSSPRIRIRGFNSLSQPNNPLIIIDGARVDNTTGAGGGGGTNIQSYGWTAGSVTSMNPEEIESFEIVKGPAAATLYGTDAANGVIVIRTKRGTAGAPKWNFYGEAGLIPGPTKWNENFYAFGKNAAGQAVNCVNLARAAGQCTVDSVSQWNPMADAISSPVGTGNRRQIGAQVSGGAQQLRYFVGADWERERGYLELPESEIQRLKTLRGGAEIPDEQIHPNYLNRTALRANASAMLGPRTDLNLSNSLQFQRSQIPTNTVFTDAAWGAGYKDAFDGWLNQRRPGESFATRAQERLFRITSSANGNFVPTPWLLTRATVGVDAGSNFSDNLQRRDEGGTAVVPSLGRRLDVRSSTILFTGDVGASATFTLMPSIVSKTSAGAQYNRRERGITTAQGLNLPPGSSTLAGAATVTNSEATIQSVVAGGYVEQQFSLNDRLFVTGAMRADGASTFGKNFKTAYYPKASLSWLVSSEDWFPKTRLISSFRFRTAYGSSGVQPPADAALTRLQLATVFVNGTTGSGAQLQTLGNPNLAPERTTELEGGFDVEFLDGRISLEATAYEKKSKDALVQRSYPRSAGLIATGQLDNVGRVRNRGVEGILSAMVFKAGGTQLDISLNGSINHSNLLELDSSLRPPEDRFIKFVQGYPLFGMWDRKIRGYNDANNDGVLQISEAQVDDSITFLGVTNPTDLLTFSPSLSVFNGLLRFNSMFVYKGGHLQTNFSELNKCASFGSCKARNDPNASVAEQAPYAGFAGTSLTYAGYAEDGTFTRWAEASVVWDASRSFRGVLGSRSATLTFSARNLALWTDYSGLDPEVTAFPISRATSAPSGISGTTTRCRRSRSTSFFDFPSDCRSRQMTLRISRLTAAAGLLFTFGCSSLTDVDSPDVVQPEQLANAAGAEALTTGALASIMSPFMTFAYNTGVFSDELKLATLFTSFADVDFRTQSLTFNEYGPILMHRVRTQTQQAIEARKQFAPTPRSRIGQLFATKGLAELFIGETSCNGTPLTDIRGTAAVFSGPLTSDSMLKIAVSNFDSALVYAADSARVLNLAKVARGRALLNRGQYAQAAAAVTGVPTNYVYNAEATLSVPFQINLIWNNNNLRVATVANREGGNGLDFVSAADPRVPTTPNGLGTDGVTNVAIFAKYSGQASSIPMVTGIEARLIEAEAALQANRNDTSPTGTGWLGILNSLRATGITPGMAPLADPGSFDARVNLLFRERAFWMFGTGHRMGDLRRLLRQYGRAEAATWPKGVYKAGVSYGNEVVFIITLSEQANPNVRTCADKNP